MNVIKTIFAAVVMGLVAKFGYGFLATYMDYKIAVLITVAISAVVYFAIIYFTKAITKEEMKEVRG